MSVQSSIQGYSDLTLAGIIRDLRANPMAKRSGTWEAKRLVLLEGEHRRRVREAKQALSVRIPTHAVERLIGANG